ncbi:CDGSH iron-sulfur domain-containing protein 1 [Solea senegalensis]|uniref:CDGSH iron-sulfur domain-containing protein 1 n=1 Tax=Solea senegalensis TaxID=28829 RepID=A0AAV6SLK0_SOLSE|nr:CDGSH iron-sulfur domain-containing protein 1 [Solea senegalensis]KAG7518935.1 CDGSH iron-sulfur domain-containing protein 1 [Solea senegalensis]
MTTPGLPAMPVSSTPAVPSAGFRFTKEHLVVAVPVAVVAAVGGFLVSHYLSSGRSCKKGQVNTTVSKDSPKVVHSFDMEDIGTKAVYCRCWKSKKFPYCDGAHAKHNDATGDNVGPLIIKKKDA